MFVSLSGMVGKVDLDVLGVNLVVTKIGLMSDGVCDEGVTGLCQRCDDGWEVCAVSGVIHRDHVKAVRGLHMCKACPARSPSEHRRRVIGLGVRGEITEDVMQHSESWVDLPTSWRLCDMRHSRFASSLCSWNVNKPSTTSESVNKRPDEP